MLSSLGGTGTGGSVVPVAQIGWEYTRFGLSVVEITAIWSLVSSFVALSMLALFSDWTKPAVRTARQSTLMSAVVGLVAAAVLFAIYAVTTVVTVGNPVVGAIVGFFLFVPLFFFGLASYAVSVVTFGAAISRRLGRDSIWLGVFVGAVTLTLLSFVPLVGRLVTFAVQVVGLGASLRVTFGGGASESTERSVPSERYV